LRSGKCLQLGNCIRLRAHVVDSRYFARITPINTTNKLVDESRCDVAKDILDRLVFNFRMIDSDRALKNADTLRVLIEDGLDVFSGNPIVTPR
jgi:hypothetical protein